MKHRCEDCRMSMTIKDIVGGCDKCGNYDEICKVCFEIRKLNPSCKMCSEGCSQCPVVGDEYSSNTMGFDECYCVDCPVNAIFRGHNTCETCFKLKAAEYGCQNLACKVWTAPGCGHFCCTALQVDRAVPEGECGHCYTAPRASWWRLIKTPNINSAFCWQRKGLFRQNKT